MTPREKVIAAILGILAFFFVVRNMSNNSPATRSSLQSPPAAVAQSPSAVSTQSPSAVGTVRLKGLIGCPEDWQFMSYYGYLSQNDNGAAQKALREYGCKVISEPIDVYLSDPAAGFICARPRGDTTCYWTFERWINEARQ